MKTLVAPAPSDPAARDNTRAASMINVVDRNTLVWWALLAASALAYRAYGPWGGLLWLAALAADDVLLWVFGRPLLFDSQLRARRGYQWMHNLYDGTAGRGRDLGFNLAVDGALSQRAKYEHMASKLGLKRGMKVCDVGCGYGDWLRYCRDELGCETAGVNLTPEQADYARREYGLEVHVANWKAIAGDAALRGRLYARFDAVTFMDTVEHYVSMEDRKRPERQRRIYSDMCLLARRLLRDSSQSGRVFISCLHQTRKPRDWRFYIHAYFMDKMYSGHYPFADEGPLRECAAWFTTESVEDKTEDYRLTGVLDRRHFQAVKVRLTARKALYALALLALDPFVPHRMLYYALDSWMFFYGDDPYSPRYDAARRRATSWVVLYWATLKLKPGAPRA